MPDDPTKKPLTSAILKEGYVNVLVSDINSLSHGIELTECTEEDIKVVTPGDVVCVFETDLGKTAEEIELYKVNVKRYIKLYFKELYTCNITKEITIIICNSNNSSKN